MSKESCVYDSKTDVNVYHTVTFLNSHDSSRWFINVKVEGFIYLSESLTISFKRRCIMTRLIYIYVDIHVCRLEVRVTQTVLSLFWCYDEMHLSPLQLNCRCIFFFDVFLRRTPLNFPKFNKVVIDRSILGFHSKPQYRVRILWQMLSFIKELLLGGSLLIIFFLVKVMFLFFNSLVWHCVY